MGIAYCAESTINRLEFPQPAKNQEKRTGFQVKSPALKAAIHRIDLDNTFFLWYTVCADY